MFSFCAICGYFHLHTFPAHKKDHHAKKVKKKEKASFDSFFLLGLPRKISNLITSS